MKSPRGFRGKYFSLAAILALSSTVTLANKTQSYTDSQSGAQKQEIYSEDEEQTPTQEETPIVVITKKIKVKVVDAPFASEIYTKAQIEKSHAKNIYEFLNTQTSITTMPNAGNKFTQKIDMRGYGIANGYENIVISVDGRRLNNIDMVPQLLSSIPIDSIKRIEIIKGSGSVEYGDGANAGVINIITQNYEGTSIKTYMGSNGLKYTSLGLGIKRKKFSISGYVDGYSQNGEKQIALDGTKDNSWNKNKSIKGTFSPIENLTLNIGKTFSKMQLKYPNALTLSKYEQNPKTIPLPTWGVDYSEQYFSSDILNYGAKYKINEKISLKLQATNEDKISNFITYASKNNYNYKTYNSKINYTDGNLKTSFGIQKFNGTRNHKTTSTQKNNLGYYVKADYTVGNNSISIGARGESVKYKYITSNARLSDSSFLHAYDLGYSHKLDSISSIFVNLNQSFQAPDIDRFFNAFTNTFNGFIKPMKVKTINIGYNNLSYPNKIKISAFYSAVNDEIYYNAASYKNTNLDKTRKIGFEIYDKYNIFYNLFTAINYSYVDTKIIKDSTNPSVVGNEIPGVSNHNVKFSFGYNPTYRISLLLSHIYRSKAYAMSDFYGTYGKMQSYNRTDFSATYKYKKFDFFVKVNNILNKKNALFADSGSSLGVYPVNYERNFLIGVNAKF